MQLTPCGFNGATTSREFLRDHVSPRDQSHLRDTPVALRRVGAVLVLIVEIKRDYRVFLAEGPPPAEARQTGEHEVRVALPPESLNEVQYSVERLLRASIVRTDADVTAEFEDRRFLARIETGLLEDHHPLRLAEYVVVESAFRDTIFR